MAQTRKIKKPQNIVSKKCMMCGKEQQDPYKAFFRSQSVLFSGNGHYVPICSTCREELFAQYIQFFDGDERNALERMCMMFDVYYSDDIYDSVVKTKSQENTTFFSNYMSRVNLLRRLVDKTYNSTIVERSLFTKGVTNTDDVEMVNDAQIIEQHTTKVRQEDLQLFGSGWTPDELRDMRAFHDNMLKDRNNLTFREQSDLISACKTRTLAERALRERDTQNYIKLNGLYQDTIEQFEERMKKESSVQQSVTDPVGIMIKQIEQHTPAEYYKDKQLFKDADSIGKYIERFMLRPLRNLITGSKELDPEYAVGEDEE